MALERGEPRAERLWAFLEARSGPSKSGRARAQAARQGLRRVSKAEAEKPHRHASSAMAPPRRGTRCHLEHEWHTARGRGPQSSASRRKAVEPTSPASALR